MPRPLCNACGNPPARCICDLTVQIDTRTRLLVWQHPKEQNHPKGTVKLLLNCLPNSRLIVAEKLNLEDIQVQSTNQRSDSLPVLLFPSDKQDNEIRTPQSTVDTLLLLDGTWRKTRRMIYENPWLSSLPRLSLDITAANSNYRIRKAEKPGQLSTLEAACQAINQLEGKAELTQPVIQAFDRYMQRLTDLQAKQ